MKYNIAFYCNSVPFSADTINLETSLGGSESALVYMARELALLGHEVTVFTGFEDVADCGMYDGVRWEDAEKMLAVSTAIEYDVFISLRMFQIMDEAIRAKCRIIWNQDVLTMPREYCGSLWQVDQLYYVSSWQQQHYQEFLPASCKELGYATKNGIDLATVDQAVAGVERDPNKLIYISRPERGLFPLLEIFEKMNKDRPALELHVARYYSMYEPNPNVKKICDEADRRMAHAENVHYLGNLNKHDLYKEIASSKLMLYPGVENFNETSCIAALEAQACRTPLICSAKGGLNETLHAQAGSRIEGDAHSEEYQTNFIRNAFFLMDHDNFYQSSQDAGRTWVENHYQYKDIAAEWSDQLDRFFADRFAQNKSRIVENLIHHDDFVAARYVDANCELPEANESPESYSETALTLADEMARIKDGFGSVSARPRAMTHLASELEPERILDFACGNGAITYHIKDSFPQAHVVGIDYSAEMIKNADEYCKSVQKEIEFRVGSFEAIREDKFDLIFCGEFLEHNDDYQKVIDDLESHLNPGGWIVWSVPTGPMHEYLLAKDIGMRGHKIHWDSSAIHQVFGEKPGFLTSFINLDPTPRGNVCGHYIIKHQAGPTGEIDLEHKTTTMRPYQSLSVCMITHNEEKHLARCLDSLKYIADEIIIADMESDDDTIRIAEKFDAIVEPKPAMCPDLPELKDAQGTVIPLPAPGSFEWARNESIKNAKGDWILWIDADEELVSPEQLRKNLDSAIFEGMALRQNHLIWDAEKRHDKPVRLFRNNRGYRFWGAIHEHAQKSINDPIEPAFELPESAIMHYGYVTENMRQRKCRERNLALLMVDRTINPDRDLGKVLLQRDYLNMVHWEVSDHGQLTPRAHQFLMTIIDTYKANFTDTKHRMHDLSFQQYQKAMDWLDGGVPFEVTIQPAQQNGNGAIRVETPGDLQAYVARKTAEAIAKLPHSFQ